MSLADPAYTQAAHVAISKSKGIKIDWGDGHHSEYGLQFLRDICPCAACNGTHDHNAATTPPVSPFQMYKPALKLAAAEPTGSYAVQLKWNDGHNSGIYSYEYLRRMCPCDECRSS